MNRFSWALILVIALELVGTALWFSFDRAAVPAELPLPDLAILDPVSASEVRSRQERVRKEGTPESWTDLATIYVMFGYFREADACCRRSDELNPESLANNFWWGTTLCRLGRLDESSERFRTAIRSAPSSQAEARICWYCIGLNMLREERPDEAEKAFKAVSGLAPADSELAKLYIRTGRADRAVPLLEKLSQDYPHSAWYWQLRAGAAEALGKLDQAEDFLERAERSPGVHPSDELTGFLETQVEKHGLDQLIQKGIREMESGRMPEAAKTLQDVLSNEWRPLPADRLAEAELAIGRPDESIRILTEAMNRFSATPGRIIALGDAWRVKGNMEEAVRLWERATRLHVARPAHERLAEYYAQVGNQSKATRHRALVAHGDGLDAFRQDQLAPAAKSFATAVELAPDLAHSWFYLGECRRFLNEPSAAAEAYQRCIELDQYHGRARHSLERLVTSKDRTPSN